MYATGRRHKSESWLFKPCFDIMIIVVCLFLGGL